MKFRSVDRVSLACTLQLSGIALDADCPGGMRGVFDRLKRRATMPCVQNVVALRAARWGLAEPAPQHQDPRRRYSQ